MKGDIEAGTREGRQREVCGRGERKGREAGFPRWREAGELGKQTTNHCAQSKKCREVGANNKRGEPGLKGTGSGRFGPPPVTHHLSSAGVSEINLSLAKPTLT